MATMESLRAALDQLQDSLNGCVCVLGVGNRQRCDDGAGSVLADALHGQTGVLVVDAGTVPENYLEKVARAGPDTVVIIDAVDFGGAPGDVRVVEPESIAPAGLSTHALSLRMAVQYLRARTGARVILLAIQPGAMGSGEQLSEPVSRTVAVLGETLPGVFGQKAYFAIRE